MKLKALMFVTTMMAATLGAELPAYGDRDSFLPEEHTQGSIAFLTGGIGMQEAKAIELAAKDYPLTMEFLIKAQPRSEFTAGVKVVVKDHTGKVVLDTLSTGPFLLARLPSGSYTVTAERGEDLKTRHVQVFEKRSKHVIFEWNRETSRPERDNEPNKS